MGMSSKKAVAPEEQTVGEDRHPKEEQWDRSRQVP